ncbi:hypothetical protein MB901379_00616 [Mycobacterium basiliense]|uniref:Uncharacterized protein n=1 Tax=Mycobacterium basiliense TaxID=2094119 RepID=A0A3S4FK93_9MYCO|nr:hypothetical protein MB901379_00616 [Mycobacterium basiliense]
MAGRAVKTRGAVSSGGTVPGKFWAAGPKAPPAPGARWTPGSGSAVGV